MSGSPAISHPWTASSPSRPIRRFRACVGVTSRLEERQLLTVAITEISRLTSVSLLNEPVRDAIPLSTPTPGSPQQGTIATLQSYSYGNSLSKTDIGGTGLEVRFTSTNPSEIGSRPVIVQVDWGDPNPSRFNPLQQTVFRTSTSASGSWSDQLTLPHTYNAAGNYTARVTLTEVARAGDPTPAPAVAVIQVRVGAFIEGSQGFFYRGSMGPDTVTLAPDPTGGVLVQASDSRSVVTLASRLYLDTLDGEDRVIADAGVAAALFIDAGGGNDRVVSGSGDDQIRGGPGDDAIDGMAGADVIFAGAGADRVDGGADADQIDGGSGPDRILGADGDDRIFGDVGDDWLDGGPGNDLLLGGLGADGLRGGEGDDVLAGDFSSTLPADFPAEALVRGWADGLRPRDLFRLATNRVRLGSTDLTPLSFATVAAGRKLTRPLDLGPTLANDAAIDQLDGEAGRDALFGHYGGPPAARDRVVGADRTDVRFHLTDAPARTVRDVRTFTGYTTSSGADLTTNPTRGTYLLYKTVPDGNNLLDGLNPSGQSAVEFAGYYGTPVPAAFRILNLNEFSNYTPLPVFWAGFNRPFLAYAGAFGGVILEASDVHDPKNLFDVFDGSDSSFRREFRYLTRTNGPVPELFAAPFPTYRYDPLRKAYSPIRPTS